MKVLVVKMSSLGDVVHTLPAVTDLVASRPDTVIDWVVEESFSAIPAMHPAVNRVIPIAMRRWRRSPLGLLREVPAFLGQLRRTHYDVVIDPQGLIKSGLVVHLARGERIGYDAATARESLAARAYDRRIHIGEGVHAIDKIRRLFATAFDYPVPTGMPDYGLAPQAETLEQVMFLHGTTWSSKHYPEPKWQALAELVTSQGFEVLLPHGNDAELARAERVAASVAGVRVLPRLGLDELATELRQSAGVVAVDSGLGHLAAALAVPMVGLYGPTNPRLTGPVSRAQTTLASDHLPCIPCMEKDCKLAPMLPADDPVPPCFAPLTAGKVWQALQARMAPP